MAYMWLTLRVARLRLVVPLLRHALPWVNLRPRLRVRAHSLRPTKAGLCDGSETHSADRRRARGCEHAHARAAQRRLRGRIRPHRRAGPRLPKFGTL